MSKELIKREVKRDTVVTFLGTGGTMAVSFLADDVPVGSMSFNFDPTKEQFFGLLDVMDDPATREGDQHESEPFGLVYWGLKKVMLAKKGDIPERPAVRTCLVDDQGECLQFTSKGVLTSLDSIRMRYGDGPYNPPLPIVVCNVKLPNKFEMTKLRVVPDGRPEQPKK